MYDELTGLIFSLCAAGGVSGDEGEAVAAAREHLERHMPCRTDALGNLIGERGGEGRRILLTAHIDRIGLAVTAIDDGGFLKFSGVGGVDPRTLAAAEVTVLGRESLFGVIVSTPPHLAKDGDEKKARDTDSLAIDLGLSGEEARRLVSPGDRVLLRGKQRRLFGQRVVSPALDDRCGAAAILRALELLGDSPLPCSLTVVFTVQEETGGSGARTGGYGVNPDDAIAVDVSFARAPGVPEEKSGRLGGGVMIGISPTLDREMSRKFLDIAREHGIPHTCEVMGGRTGTDADGLQGVRRGVRTGLLSIPLRNMHTAAEIIDVADVESAARMLKAYILSEGGGRRA